MLYGSLAPSQQGLEKLNDHITQYYFKSTNHHSIGSLTQIMKKLNRLEYLEDDSITAVNVSSQDTTLVPVQKSNIINYD